MLGQQPEVANFLSKYAATLPRQPSAIIVVTAHWEQRATTVSTAASPSLLFDYGGFPAESYRYKYPAPGSPQLAAQVKELLKKGGHHVAEDSSRGWDHGVFVPMMLMFPEANIPIVALSLLASQDGATEIAIGEALRPLRDQGVLIVGSGASFHNFKYFFARDAASEKAGFEHSRNFDRWLREAVAGSGTYSSRRAMLTQWEQAPGAREAHPKGQAEHLMPLFVVFGAGGEEPVVKPDPPQRERDAQQSGLCFSCFELL